MKSIYTIPVFILIIIQPVFSQPNKRTNFWYFGHYAGLDFNSGEPIALTNGQTNEGFFSTAAISDTNGNLLFYTNGRYIWNKNHQQMEGGFVYFWPGTQSAIIFPKPQTDNIYYVFTSCDNEYIQYNFFYYVVDISMNDGLGKVTDVITLDEGWDAAQKLTAVYHKNKKDIWVITRKFVNDSYAAFLVTSEGVNPTPVLSAAPDKDLFSSHNLTGFMKISYDSKYLIACYYGYAWSGGDIEVCKFNNQTGEVDYLYSFDLLNTITPQKLYRAYSCEYSPNSKYLYIPGVTGLYTTIIDIFQYDMQYIEDPDVFPYTEYSCPNCTTHS